MPPRTSLIELATRRNSYVCRSCLTALGLSQPSQRFTRNYARKSRTGRGSFLPKGASETESLGNDATSKEEERKRRRFNEPIEPDALWAADLEPEVKTTPAGSRTSRPKINYFNKDPKTGKIEPIPDVDDDGEAEPDFEDIEDLGRSILDKAKVLEATLGKSDRLDHYLEKVLEKHGPPGAIEAFRAALKSYDESEEKPSQSAFSIEENSNAKIEDVMGSLAKAMSETNYDDTPELKDAVSAFQDTLKSLTDGAKGKVTVKNTGADNFDEGPRYTRFKTSLTRDYDELPPIIFSKEKHSTLQHKRLTHLANRLKQRLQESVAAIGKSETIRRERDTLTSQSFMGLVDVLSEPHTTVHDSFWQALWTIFSHEGLSNPHRLKRIRGLSKAMLDAGVSLSSEQELLAIEAAYKCGAVEEALDWWKRKVTRLGHQDSRATIMYWELGVRMWCDVGDVERAERACKNLLERSTPFNPADSRVLLHLIQVYCASPDTAEKGFGFYRRMRDLATKLEKPLEIQDYDDVISVFLRTGHTDYAMYTFTDMMFAGTIDLYGKARLPNQTRNQFFFGKWLKRLIGEGDLDGAYKVLVFMQKNSVMAASIQVNGLIGAWLRTGTVANREKAYSLAWAMIRSRQTFVDLRKREALVEWPIRLQDHSPNAPERKDEAEMDYGMVPRATVETFIILAGQYRERGLFNRLEELFVAYKQCEMPGDAMMMNELIAAAVAQDRGDMARELYNLMVHEHDVLPSIDTFAILFSSLPTNRSRLPVVNERVIAESTSQARAVFADMMRSSWAYHQEKTGPRGPKSPLSEQQAKLILHSFRKVEDWAGVSVALMGLRDVMKYQLTRGVMLEMIEGIEGIDRPTPRVHKLIIRATLKLQQLVETMQQQGQLDTNLTAEGMKDWKVLYKILVSFYHTKLQKSTNENIGDLIQQAKEEMGLAEAALTAPTDVD
ncbi:hypothetical protein N0V93_003965 [Gnomoniopsis smithogilvyi]|uniref:Pentatricopeptide repeat protein n=1 Tax=Gnomoniopsis smithogilvyi TaxID=1191159 RepID=A0A9W8YZH9_9PEZI|nr:hypothetical protein N0V93_003965 [Gnomoniopsis smithogilvyi]